MTLVAVVTTISDASFDTSGQAVPGSLGVRLYGAVAPCTYVWSSGSTAPAITAPAGLYSITVTDSTGAVTTASGMITQRLGVFLTPINPTSQSAVNGSVTASVQGGSTPYLYSWSQGGSNNSVSSSSSLRSRLKVGKYKLTVRDQNSLTGTASVSLSAPPGTASFSTQSLAVGADLDVGDSASMYFGGRNARLTFDSTAGTILLQKYVGGVWETSLEV